MGSRRVEGGLLGRVLLLLLGRRQHHGIDALEVLLRAHPDRLVHAEEHLGPWGHQVHPVVELRVEVPRVVALGN